MISYCIMIELMFVFSCARGFIVEIINPQTAYFDKMTDKYIQRCAKLRIILGGAFFF